MMRYGPGIEQMVLGYVCRVALAVATVVHLALVAKAPAQDAVQQGLPGSASATRLRLPRGVSVELPDDWVILSKEQRGTLNETMKVNAGALQPLVEGSELSFAANWLDEQGKVQAILNLRYYPDAADDPNVMTQGDLEDLSAADLREVDEVMRSETVKAVSAIGGTLMKWGGVRCVDIGDLAALEREYIRASADGSGAFRVRTQRVPLGEQTFSVTVSYRVDAEPIVGPVCGQILKSLQVARYTAGRRSERPVVEHTQAAVETVSYTPDTLPPPPSNPADVVGIWMLLVCACAMLIGIVAAVQVGKARAEGHR
jgi:hypothetical protein